jgi:2-polyprenyl-3-methyl-5-hydroxy-6-metoxy-1,4-benzoquinol methylase
MQHEKTVTKAADDDISSLTGPRLRSVVQAPRAKGHFLQPRWSNPGAYYERINQIVPYVAGKSVLDVGCTSGASRDDWVHAGLVRVATRVIGVDINADAVSKARQRGFDVRVADAESLLVPQEFDVVHAGELLEHLDNPRAFLAAARARLKPGGVLVLTTPNAFAISNFVYRLGGNPRVNGDHTCWYCEDTLRQLLERNDYEIVTMTYMQHRAPGVLRTRVASAIRRLLPERLAWNTLLVVARPRV